MAEKKGSGQLDLLGGGGAKSAKPAPKATQAALKAAEAAPTAVEAAELAPKAVQAGPKAAAASSVGTISRPASEAAIEIASVTSSSHPMRVHWLSEEARLGWAPAGLGIAHAPGLKDPAAPGVPWDRDLARDLDALAAAGVAMLVDLLPDSERARLGIASIEEEAARRGIEVARAPIAVGAAPAIERALEAIELALAAGKKVVIVSREGIERAGAVAGAIGRRAGQDADTVLASLRAVRGRRVAASEALEAWVRAIGPVIGSAASAKAEGDRPEGLTRLVRRSEDGNSGVDQGGRNEDEDEDEAERGVHEDEAERGEDEAEVQDGERNARDGGEAQDGEREEDEVQDGERDERDEEEDEAERGVHEDEPRAGVPARVARVARVRAIGLGPRAAIHAGAVLGAAIGDAMGHPTEFMSIEQIRRKWPPDGVRGFELWWDKGGKRFAPYTDDTQMAEVVLRVLLASRDGGWDLERTMQEMARGFVEWSDRPQGGHRAPGNACMSGARALARGVHWSLAGGPSAGGCGSVMRAYPFGLVLAHDLRRAEEWSVAHSKLTHRDPIALAASAAMAVGVARVVRGEPVREVLSEMIAAAARYSARTAAMMAEALEDADRGVPPEQTLDRLRGWAAHEAIAAAVYLFARNPEDPETAILEGANSSGDSDSLATLAGALAGARAGLGAIPEAWARDVERSDELLALALRIDPPRS